MGDVRSPRAEAGGGPRRDTGECRAGGSARIRAPSCSRPHQGHGGRSRRGGRRRMVPRLEHRVYGRRPGVDCRPGDHRRRRAGFALAYPGGRARPHLRGRAKPRLAARPRLHYRSGGHGLPARFDPGRLRMPGVARRVRAEDRAAGGRGGLRGARTGLPRARHRGRHERGRSSSSSRSSRACESSTERATTR